ncbi:MAG: NAD(P)/FAD-dependent oxidoreductase [Hyphomicrobiaceae bacterium]
MKTAKFDVAVVGGGITGLTAAHHAAHEGAAVVHLIGSGVPGGLVANVGDLEGFPAAGPLPALDVALRLTEENGRLGVEVVPEDATRIEKTGNRFLIVSESGARDVASVVAATGARLRMLDVPGAARLLDKGVSQCAWCNGSLHRDQEVVVIGGGDSAVQEALHLTKFASRVTIVTRGENLRARSSLVTRAADNERIDFRWETDVLEIAGADAVSGVRLRDRATGAEDALSCAGVFVYVGLQPNTEWLNGCAPLTDDGLVPTDAHFETQTSGLFAAGAVRKGYGGRLTHAVGEATAAAMAAARMALA